MNEQRLGSDFDDFLREEKLLDAAQSTAANRVVAFQSATQTETREAMDSAVASAKASDKPAVMGASVFWRITVFQIVIVASLAFVAVTILAMLTYAGGTNANLQNAGYSFFTNFFSDLGRTVSYNGSPNTVSMILFSIALTCAGAGLALFFVAFTQFFRTPHWARILSITGSLFGIGAGICFVGVAFTPADIARPWHGLFVLWAFALFPIAVLCYIPVILKRDEYPNIYAFSFIAFAVLLILYFVLIRMGPRAGSPDGLLIQATGQKIIVYASIFSIVFQAMGALRVNRGK